MRKRPGSSDDATGRCWLLGGVSPLVGIEAGAGRLPLRREATFPSTLRHRLPTARTVSRAEARFVEQMSQGTTCGSVCFLPLALVMHDYANLREIFQWPLRILLGFSDGGSGKKARAGSERDVFHHPLYHYSHRGHSAPELNPALWTCCGPALVREGAHGPD